MVISIIKSKDRVVDRVDRVSLKILDRVGGISSLV
jgi:hypothetical protein